MGRRRRWRLKPRLERHEIRLRGLWPNVSGAPASHEDSDRCGRAGAWDAAHGRAAESAQADFASFPRRIHSLLQADGTSLDHGVDRPGDDAGRNALQKNATSSTDL
jgi:hypothetical protein